jgi:hypothetical protein
VWVNDAARDKLIAKKGRTGEEMWKPDMVVDRGNGFVHGFIESKF